MQGSVSPSSSMRPPDPFYNNQIAHPSPLPSNIIAPPSPLPSNRIAPPSPLPNNQIAPPIPLPSNRIVPPSPLPSNQIAPPSLLPSNPIIVPPSPLPSNQIAPPSPLSSNQIAPPSPLPSNQIAPSLRALQLKGSLSPPLQLKGRRDTIKILRNLKEMHREKRKEIAAKRWAKSVQMEKKSGEAAIPESGDCVGGRKMDFVSLVRTTTKDHLMEPDVIQLPDFSERITTRDISRNQAGSLTLLPEVTSDHEPSHKKDPPALEDSSSQLPVPPKLLQDKRSKWQRVNFRSQEKFSLAVAQEKVVLMNRVVGKINYKGRDRIRSNTLLAFLSMLFCCFCIGFMALGSSVRAKECKMKKQYYGAKIHARRAKRWAIAAILAGLCIYGFSGCMYVVYEIAERFTTNRVGYDEIAGKEVIQHKDIKEVKAEDQHDETRRFGGRLGSIFGDYDSMPDTGRTKG